MLASFPASPKLNSIAGKQPTKNLLQLHDTGIGPDAVNGLCLSCILTLLEYLAIGSIGIVLVGHDGVRNC